MAFSPRGLLYFVGFLVAVGLALNAKEGDVASWLGMAGIAAVILVDWVLTLWPVLGRSRERNGGSSS